MFSTSHDERKKNQTGHPRPLSMTENAGADRRKEILPKPNLTISNLLYDISPNTT